MSHRPQRDLACRHVLNCFTIDNDSGNCTITMTEQGNERGRDQFMQGGPRQEDAAHLIDEYTQKQVNQRVHAQSDRAIGNPKARGAVPLRDLLGQRPDCRALGQGGNGETLPRVAGSLCNRPFPHCMASQSIPWHMQSTRYPKQVLQ